MKKIIILLAFISVQLASAALPPQFQNTKDLKVMVAFIEAHPKISSSLESIDLKGFNVFYNGGCKASFSRKKRIMPKGWVGPAATLEFIQSTCDIE